MVPDFWEHEDIPHAGDIVTIVSAEVYRNRGGNCSDGCAIAYYAGSVCEVVSEEEYAYADSMYKIVPINEVHNSTALDEDKYHNSISEYRWDLRSLELVVQKEQLGDAFDDVF